MSTFSCTYHIEAISHYARTVTKIEVEILNVPEIANTTNLHFGKGTGTGRYAIWNNEGVEFLEVLLTRWVNFEKGKKKEGGWNLVKKWTQVNITTILVMSQQDGLSLRKWFTLISVHPGYEDTLLNGLEENVHYFNNGKIWSFTRTYDATDYGPLLKTQKK